MSDRIDIYSIEEEYSPSDDIFTEDSDVFEKAKKAVWTRLDETDRRIILCYAELGNIRDTAKVFNVSPTTIWNRIDRIRKTLREVI